MVDYWGKGKDLGISSKFDQSFQTTAVPTGALNRVSKLKQHGNQTVAHHDGSGIVQRHKKLGPSPEKGRMRLTGFGRRHSHFPFRREPLGLERPGTCTATRLCSSSPPPVRPGHGSPSREQRARNWPACPQTVYVQGRRECFPLDQEARRQDGKQDPPRHSHFGV